MEESGYTTRPLVAPQGNGSGREPEDVLAEAVENAPRRAPVLSRLLAACGPYAEQPSLPAIFVYGPTGAGKTHTVRALMQVGEGGQSWWRGGESRERAVDLSPVIERE